MDLCFGDFPNRHPRESSFPRHRKQLGMELRLGVCGANSVPENQLADVYCVWSLQPLCVCSSLVDCAGDEREDVGGDGRGI